MKLTYVVQVKTADEYRQGLIADFDRRYNELSLSYSRAQKQREITAIGIRMAQIRELREFLSNTRIEEPANEPTPAQQG